MDLEESNHVEVMNTLNVGISLTGSSVNKPEGFLVESSLKITDALGEALRVPLMFCRSLDVRAFEMLY